MNLRKLRDPRDWNVGLLKALALSDGAFKLYVWLRLNARIDTGRLEISQSDLSRPLNKARGTIRCCALVGKACPAGFTTLYFRAEKFFRTLAVAYADGSFDKVLSRLSRVGVLAIDDWGIAPMGDRERRHLLEVLEDRDQARWTAITSQFPIDTWHQVVGSPTLADALVERILTRAHRIELQGETVGPLARGRQCKEALS